MSGLLPAPLRRLLEQLAEGAPSTVLAARAAAISALYRDGRDTAPGITTETDALAYALVRMPATFAAVQHGLQALLDAAPSLPVRSVLDVGCGPGTAALAALDLLHDLEAVRLVDRNGPLLDLARHLTRENLFPHQRVDIEQSDLSRPFAGPPHDLVIASYVLVEMPEVKVIPLVEALWRSASGALLLVEPGTPEGFRRLRAVRRHLIQIGAHIAAPCTHDRDCPLQGADWCHVKTRVQRSRLHRLLKDADVPYEDEPLTYLAVTRDPPDARLSHRVIRPPHLTKAEVALTCCMKSGLSVATAARRDKTKFKTFSKIRWGDALLIPIQDVDASNP